MLVLEREPQVGRVERPAELSVERTDISFEDVAGGRVRIRVTVHNLGEQRSEATAIRLESAVLGAFVPWQPLAQLTAPALEPGEARELSIEVDRPRPTPLADFDRLPPRRLLSAVATASGAPGRPGAAARALVDLLRRTGKGAAKPPTGRSLAPDLWDLAGRGQPYWAGNINVFIGRRAVERHRASALRIYPGRTNLAMFLVGELGRVDAYAFEITGLAPSWEAGLWIGEGAGMVIGGAHQAITETDWIKTEGAMAVLLRTCPPADCRVGNLEVHVTRRSSGEIAVVEFNLDPTAQGPGCYWA